MIVAALMWSTWKHWNNVLFGRCSWSGMQVLWMHVVKLLKRFSHPKWWLFEFRGLVAASKEKRLQKFCGGISTRWLL
jgi:hypothetical protein